LEALGDVKVFERSTSAEILKRAFDAAVLLTKKAALPAAVIESLPQLKFVSVMATWWMCQL